MPESEAGIEAMLVELRQQEMLDAAGMEEQLATIMDEYRGAVSDLELAAKRERSQEEKRFAEHLLDTNSAVRQTLGAGLGADTAREQGSHWEEHLDTTSGAVYYFDTRTGRSQWECPEELDKPSELDGKVSGEMLECNICLDVVKGNPVQCQHGHLYCKVCLQKHMHDNGRACPVCRVAIPENPIRSLLAEHVRDSELRVQRISSAKTGLKEAQETADTLIDRYGERISSLNTAERHWLQAFWSCSALKRPHPESP
eukprot:g1916.t1